MTDSPGGAVLVRRRDAIANRVALLDAGLTALTRDPEATLETVARAAGLSRRTVYGHFSSREDLLRAVARRAGDRLDRVAGRSPAEDDGADDDAGDGTADAAGGGPLDDPATALARFELVAWDAAEPASFVAALARRPEHAHLAGTLCATLGYRRQDVVRRGQDDGVFRTDLDAAVLARLAGTVVLGVFDEVVAGTVATHVAARVAAVTALAVVGVAPAKAARCVETAVAG
ncbi:MAG: TetR/AcrR family transcriptional regulator [Kineosporiaceae bacterium]